MKVLFTLLATGLFALGTNAHANLVVECAKGYTFVEGQGCVQEGDVDHKELKDDVEEKQMENHKGLDDEKTDNKKLEDAED